VGVEKQGVMMERIQLGGRSVVGFGSGDFFEEVGKKYDPLYACHNDEFVKLKVWGAVVATSLVTAGVILYVAPWMRSEYELRKRS
jgi:hypothetical protein